MVSKIIAGELQMQYYHLKIQGGDESAVFGTTAPLDFAWNHALSLSSTKALNI